MIRDALLTFSDNQAIAAGNSQNVIDLGPLSGGNTARQIGAGTPLYLALAFPASLVGTLTVNLQTSDTEGGTYTTVTSTTVAPADATAGKKFAVSIPTTGLKRFLRLSYAGGTAGTIWAGIVQDVGQWTLYHGGYDMDQITYPVTP